MTHLETWKNTNGVNFSKRGSFTPDDDNYFYVSYNPGPVDFLSLALGGDGTPETALYDKKSDKFRILNGDWSKEYDELIPKGFEACLEFYKSKEKDFKNKFTTEE